MNSDKKFSWSLCSLDPFSVAGVALFDLSTSATGVTAAATETQFQIADIFRKALDAVTFIRIRDMPAVSASSTLNLVANKAKESRKKEEPVEKKQMT